jgi:hypothetical protein
VISFALRCGNSHEFEAWFRSSRDFDAQKARKLVACPVCGSEQVDKALMAPAISTGKKQEKLALAMSQEQRQMMTQLKELSERVRQGAENVGSEFAEEARKIHFGEAAPRGIYGEASPEEARKLAEEGVEFMPLPVFPEDRN